MPLDNLFEAYRVHKGGDMTKEEFMALLHKCWGCQGCAGRMPCSSCGMQLGEDGSPDLSGWYFHRLSFQRERSPMQVMLDAECLERGDPLEARGDTEYEGFLSAARECMGASASKHDAQEDLRMQYRQLVRACRRAYMRKHGTSPTPRFEEAMKGYTMSQLYYAQHQGPQEYAIKVRDMWNKIAKMHSDPESGIQTAPGGSAGAGGSDAREDSGSQEGHAEDWGSSLAAGRALGLKTKRSSESGM